MITILDPHHYRCLENTIRTHHTPPPHYYRCLENLIPIPHPLTPPTNNSLPPTITDALKTLSLYHAQHGDSVARDISDGYILSDQCDQLVDCCREKCTPADVKRLVDALFAGAYMKKGTYSLLKKTVLAFVEKLVHRCCCLSRWGSGSGGRGGVLLVTLLT